MSRVAVLWNPTHSEASASFRETEVATRALRLHLESIEVRSAGDLEGAFRRAVTRHADALTVLLDPVTLFHEVQVTELAARSRIPAIFYEKRFATAGGLMAYGPRDDDLHRRLATYVDKILRGRSPPTCPSSEGGIVRPRALAVLRLTISSNFVGCKFSPHPL
jgi:ABC-type uncharacterized transport system substrate-binding protein